MVCAHGECTVRKEGRERGGWQSLYSQFSDVTASLDRRPARSRHKSSHVT